MASRLTQEQTKTHVKPGVYTTEFWTTVLGTAFMVGNATDVFQYIPHNVSAVLGAVIVAAYNVSRGLAK